MFFREVLEFTTKTDEFCDITKDIEALAGKCGIREGMCSIFVMGTTAGVMVNENDRMLLEDFRRLFNSIVPGDKLYMHPENAFSHLRASLLNSSVTIPVSNGKLLLGDWQSIMLWEFDTYPRKRKVVVTIFE